MAFVRMLVVSQPVLRDDEAVLGHPRVEQRARHGGSGWPGGSLGTHRSSQPLRALQTHRSLRAWRPYRSLRPLLIPLHRDLARTAVIDSRVDDSQLAVGLLVAAMQHAVRIRDGCADGRDDAKHCEATKNRQCAPSPYV